MSLFCLDTDPTCKNDAAVNVLSNIFGSKFIEGFISSGNPASSMPNATDIAPIILGGLGMVACMLAVVVFISLSITALITSAQDGEAFGKGSAKSIIFARFLFSILMLLPTNSGYCTAQIILMMFVLWSNAETNEIYTDVVAASAMSNVGMTSNFNAIRESQDVYGVRGVALAHFAQAYCYNLVNANYYKETFTPATVGHSAGLNPIGNVSSIYIQNNNRGINAHILKDTNLSRSQNNSINGSITTIGLLDLGGKLSKDAKRSVCGSLKIYTPKVDGFTALSDDLSDKNNALGMSTDDQKAVFKAISEASRKIAENKKGVLLQVTADVSEWMHSANIPYDYSSGSAAYRDQLMAVEWSGLERVIETAVQKGNSDFRYVATDTNLPTLVQNLTTALTAKGWTYAGGIKQRIITAQSSLSGSLNHPVVSLTRPQIQFLDVQDERAHSFAEAIAISRSVVEGLLGKQDFATSSDLGMVSENLPAEFSEDSSADEISNQVQEGYASFLSNFRRGLTHLLLTGQYETGTPEAMLSNNLQADWLNSDRDVLANIQRTGEFISVMSMKLDTGLKGVTTASIAATGASGTFDTVYRVAYAVFLAISNVLAPAITKILFYLGILGVYMAVILPSMPYFFFITGVVAWYIHILQAMAAMPFWAIMHMIPERSFAGSQTQGYVTVIGLFLRPMLTLTGLFFGFILANPILLYVTDTFFSMQENLMTSNSEIIGAGLYQIITELATFFKWLIVYCTLMLQICYMIFGLAGTLPDSVLKWLGTGLSAGGWGESNAQSALSDGSRAGVEDSKIKTPKAASKPGGKDSPPSSPDGGGGGGGGLSPNGVQPSNPSAPANVLQTGVDDQAAIKQQNAAGSQPSGSQSSIAQPGISGVNQGSIGANNVGANLGANPNNPASLSPQSQSFQSMGGVVGADGKPLDNKALWKANVSRSPESQVGFARSMATGYAVGGVVGAIKGVKAGVASASIVAANGAGMKGTIGAFASGMGQSIKSTASSTSNFMGNQHLAQVGGLGVTNGSGVSFTKGSNVNSMSMLSAYNNAKKANQ